MARKGINFFRNYFAVGKMNVRKTTGLQCRTSICPYQFTRTYMLLLIVSKYFLYALAINIHLVCNHFQTPIIECITSTVTRIKYIAIIYLNWFSLNRLVMRLWYYVLFRIVDDQYSVLSHVCWSVNVLSGIIIFFLFNYYYYILNVLISYDTIIC